MLLGFKIMLAVIVICLALYMMFLYRSFKSEYMMNHIVSIIGFGIIILAMIYFLIHGCAYKVQTIKTTDCYVEKTEADYRVKYKVTYKNEKMKNLSVVYVPYDEMEYKYEIRVDTYTTLSKRENKYCTLYIQAETEMLKNNE